MAIPKLVTREVYQVERGKLSCLYGGKLWETPWSEKIQKDGALTRKKDKVRLDILLFLLPKQGKDSSLLK